MKVDLNRLDYRHAFELIKWCVDHNYDREKAVVLLSAWCTKGSEVNDWVLDIPEEYITYFILKWAI